MREFLGHHANLLVVRLRPEGSSLAGVLCVGEGGEGAAGLHADQVRVVPFQQIWVSRAYYKAMYKRSLDYACRVLTLVGYGDAPISKMNCSD